MPFEVAADAYDRFMGRYSVPLAEQFADWSGVAGPGRALDVGCGTGALTRVLIERLGVDGVSAVDPSSQLLAALRQAFPTLDVQTATAEQLPYPDDIFDHALAQLVVSFMTDPVLGLQEMSRVAARRHGVGLRVGPRRGRAPLTPFWRAARDLDPGVGRVRQAREQRGRAGAPLRPGRPEPDENTALTVTVRHPTFEDWWVPYTFGVGPAGAHVRSLDEMARVRLRDHCRQLLPDPPFYIMATAWAVRARA